MRAITSLGGGFLSFVLIAGHGGGSGEPVLPPASSAEGLYRGAAGGRAVIGLVLDDGTYYFLYSLVGNPGVIAGGLHGSSVASAGAFSTGNARDFNLEGLGELSATVSAEYVARRSIGGVVMSESSRTPESASCSVRGIGVAVSVST